MHLLTAGFQASWVAVGRRHSAAVGRDGALFTWGSGKFGKLGHGGGASAPFDCKSHLLPTWVRSSGAGPTDPWHRGFASSSWAGVGAGSGARDRPGPRPGHVLAASGPASRDSAGRPRPRGSTTGAGGGGTGGGILGWLLGVGGQAGSTPAAEDSKPLDPAEEWRCGVRVWRVACGFSHTVAVSRRGRVFAWGSNDSGQLGQPAAADGRKNAFDHPQAVLLPQGVGGPAFVHGRHGASPRLGDTASQLSGTAGAHVTRDGTRGSGLRESLGGTGSVLSDLPEHSPHPRLHPAATAPPSAGSGFSVSRSASNVITSGSSRAGHAVNASPESPASGHGRGSNRHRLSRLNHAGVGAPATPTMPSAASGGAGVLDDGASTAAEHLVRRVQGCSSVAVRWSEWRPIRGATDVACGSVHTVVATADGECVAWGRNTHGQVSGRPVGYGTTGGEQTATAAGGADGSRPFVPQPARVVHTPVVVPIADMMRSAGAGAFSWGSAVSVAAGDSHTVVSTSAGAVVTFGSNVQGQLGGPVLADESCWRAGVHLPGEALWAPPAGATAPEHADLWSQALDSDAARSSGGGGGGALARSPMSPIRPSPMSGGLSPATTAASLNGDAASRVRAPSQCSVETSGTDRQPAPRARTTAALLDGPLTGPRVRQAALQMAARRVCGSRSLVVAAGRDVTFVLEGAVPASGFRPAEHASSMHRSEVHSSRSLMEGTAKALLAADAAAGDAPDGWTATINASCEELRVLSATHRDWDKIRSIASVQAATRHGKLADLLLQCGGVPPPLRPRLYPLLARNQAHVTPVLYRECLRRGRALVAGMLRNRVQEHIGRLRGRAQRLARTSGVVLSPTGIVSPAPKASSAASQRAQLASGSAIHGRADPFVSPRAEPSAAPPRPLRLSLAAARHSAAVVRAGTPEGSPLLRSANSLGQIRAAGSRASEQGASSATTNSHSVRSDRRLSRQDRSSHSLHAASEGPATPLAAPAAARPASHLGAAGPPDSASPAPSGPAKSPSAAAPLGAWAETFLIGADDAAPAEADAAAALEAFFDSGPNAEGSGSEGGGPLAFLLGDASDTSLHHGADASVIAPVSGSASSELGSGCCGAGGGGWIGAVAENIARMDPAEAAGALAVLSRGLAGPGAHAAAGPSLDEQQRMADVADICKDLGRTLTPLHLYDVGGCLRRDIVEVVVALMGAFVDFGYSQAMMLQMTPFLVHTGSPYLTFQLTVNLLARPEMRMLFRASDCEAKRGFLRLCMAHAAAERLPRDEEHGGTYILAWLQTMFTQQVSIAQASAAMDFCLANGATGLLALVLAAHRLLSKELMRMGGGSRDSLRGGEGVAEDVLHAVLNGGRDVWQRVMVGKNLAREAARALGDIPARDASELRSLLRDPFLLTPAGRASTPGPFECAPHPAVEASASPSLAGSVRGSAARPASAAHVGAATAGSMASGILGSVAEEEEAASAPGDMARRPRLPHQRSYARPMADAASLGSAALSGGLRSLDGDDLGEDLDLSQMPGLPDESDGMEGLSPASYPGLSMGVVGPGASEFLAAAVAARSGDDSRYTPTGDAHSEVTDDEDDGPAAGGREAASQAHKALAAYSAYKKAHSEQKRRADAARAKPAPPDAFRDI